MSKNTSKNQYSADSIQALEGMEHVRKRPSMYIGDVGSRGLHHLVYEVVDNSIDEAMAGYCSSIKIEINKDSSLTVEDDGRGIPVGMHKKEGVSALEVVMTKIGAGGKFDKDSYKVSGGLHGVGVSCVNALSESLTARVFRDGKEYEQTYSKGKPNSAVKEVGKSDKRGTLVTFTPDKEIFKEVTDFDYDILSNRMRELSFLNKGLTISITDNRKKDKDGNPTGPKLECAYIDETFATKEEREAAHQKNRRTEFQILSQDFDPNTAPPLEGATGEDAGGNTGEGDTGTQQPEE